MALELVAFPCLAYMLYPNGSFLSGFVSTIKTNFSRPDPWIAAFAIALLISAIWALVTGGALTTQDPARPADDDDEPSQT